MAEANKNRIQEKKKPTVSQEVLQKLIKKFNIFYLEDEDFLRRYVRLEKAYYYYSQNYAYQHRNRFEECSKYKFFCYVLELDPVSSYDEEKVSECYGKFLEYRSYLPTYGAIILSENAEDVVMVQGSSTLWSFPKGKIDFDETPTDCAIREVYEEVGVDITDYIDSNSYIEAKDRRRYCRLYIIKNFPKDIEFHIGNRYEIKQVLWMSLDYLYNANHKYFRVTAISNIIAKKLKKKLTDSSADTLATTMEGIIYKRLWPIED